MAHVAFVGETPMSLFSTDIAIVFSSTKHSLYDFDIVLHSFLGLDTGWLTLMPLAAHRAWKRFHRFSF